MTIKVSSRLDALSYEGKLGFWQHIGVEQRWGAVLREIEHHAFDKKQQYFGANGKT